MTTPTYYKLSARDQADIRNIGDIILSLEQFNRLVPVSRSTYLPLLENIHHYIHRLIAPLVEEDPK